MVARIYNQLNTVSEHRVHTIKYFISFQNSIPNIIVLFVETPRKFISTDEDKIYISSIVLEQ
jgi:hypothetical protein